MLSRTFQTELLSQWGILKGFEEDRDKKECFKINQGEVTGEEVYHNQNQYTGVIYLGIRSPD